MPLTQTKKKQPAKFNVGDKVFYEAFGGGEYPGVITEVDWMHYGKVVYRIHIPDFRGKGPADISSFEDHVNPGQRGLFAAKTAPQYQIGDEVEYVADTKDGVWVVTRAKYRPLKKMWIYWIIPKDSASPARANFDKFYPNGISVWGWDLAPSQRSLDLKEKPKFIEMTDPKLAAKPKTKPKFQVGDKVFFNANPNIIGTISKVKGGKWEWEYYVRYKHPNQDKMVEHSYSAHSLEPAQSTMQFRTVPKFEKGEWVKAEGKGGEVFGKRWSEEYERWEYRIHFTNDTSAWYEEKAIEPLDRPLNWQASMKALSKKRANWIEKSRDMYRFEQKPIGKDRKQIIGPQAPEVKNTFLELPVKQAKSQPKYLQGDSVDIGMNAPGRVQSYFWSNEHQAYFYRVLVGKPGEEHEIGLWEIQIQPSQQRLFAMKVTAGEVLPFDPSKKKIKTGPGTGVQEFALTEDMQEDRDAIFYEFDNTLINLKELENNMLAIGESGIANNIAEALRVLKARF